MRCPGQDLAFFVQRKALCIRTLQGHGVLQGGGRRCAGGEVQEGRLGGLVQLCPGGGPGGARAQGAAGRPAGRVPLTASLHHVLPDTSRALLQCDGVMNCRATAELFDEGK